MPRIASASGRGLTRIGLKRITIIPPTPFVFEAIANSTNGFTAYFKRSSPSTNITVDWGDGSPEEIYIGDGVWPSHTYQTAGTYTATVSGILPAFGDPNGFTFDVSLTPNIITRVISWNETTTSFVGACESWQILTEVPTLPPNVTNTAGMFFDAIAFNQPIGSWDVSSVTNMSFMFFGATSFNQSLGGWDVSSVTNMNNMFDGASALVTNLTGWSVPGIGTAPTGFANNAPGVVSPIWGATQTPLITTWTNTNNATFTIFNENDLQADALIDWGDGTREVLIVDEFIVTEFNNRIIHSFPSTGTYTVTIRGYLPNFQGNVSELFLGGATPSPSSVGLTAVTEWNSTTVSLVGAFHRASALTSVPDYLPPSVVNTTDMFFDAVSINDPNIALWDVSNVTEMFSMFYNAISFNQDLSGWCVLNIGGDPSGFSDGATSWTRPKPVWETCPVRITTSNYVLGYFVDDGANSYFQVTSPDQNIQNLVSGDLVIITFFDSPSITITITYVFFNEGPGEWLIGFTTEDPIPEFVSAETQSVMTIFKTG
jgi:surface protein